MICTKPAILRSEAFDHLLAVSKALAEPSTDLLHEEYVTKHDFRDWLIHTGRPMPSFWYGA